MTWVKVCGLRRPDAVAAAVDAGADAVGFVSVPASPRYLPLDEIRALATAVPAGVRRVLLTLDLDPAALLEAVERTGVDGVQPYGTQAREAAASAVDAGCLVLLPDSRSRPSPVAGAIPLYDADVPGLLGGSGETFEWGELLRMEGDYVVAGGLGPDNVGDLVRLLHPWGVDASSRLESEPGVKDLGKVAAFVREAKLA